MSKSKTIKENTVEPLNISTNVLRELNMILINVTGGSGEYELIVSDKRITFDVTSAGRLFGYDGLRCICRRRGNT